MKKSNWSRREFLEASAAAAGVSFVAEPFTFRKVAPSDTVRFGMVGVGMQGNGLLRTSISLPGVTCAGAADLYDGRHTLAKEIAGANLPTTREFRRLLDDTTIDCIVAAVPDPWHKRMVVEAVSAGKDIYIEKPMSHTAADGVAMVDAVKKSGRILQVGSQRVSSQICAKAKDMIAQGMLGDLTLVEGWLGRNEPTGAWEYPPPPDLSLKTVDWDTWQNDVPKRPLDPNVFARWRCWKEYGTGVAGDLLVHLISGMQAVLGINEIPKRVSAFGGIYRWKDGRNMPDVHAALFEYANVPVYMRLSLDTESTEVTRFMGSKGVIELTEFGVSCSPQPGVDLSPSYYSASFPTRLKTAYLAQWHQEHDPKPGQEPAPESLSFRGNDYDDLRPHLWNFFEAVRSRKPVLQDAVFGHNAALGCHMANESYFRKKPVYWDATSQSIKS